jgi:cyanophycin synthetase
MKNSINYWSTSSQVITDEARKLWFRVEILSESANLFYIHSIEKSILFKSTDCWANTALGLKISWDKELTSIVLERAGLQLPRSRYFYRAEGELSVILENVEKNIEWLRYPLVVKPTDGSHGDWVRMDIRTIEELCEKMREGFEISKKLIVQEQVSGMEFRVLVLFGDAVLAIERRPAMIIGDWIHSIRELIEKENSTNTLRWSGYNSPLATIEIDTEVLEYIEKRWLTLDSMPESGENIQLRWNSNLGTGWTPHDITDRVHPEIFELSIKAAQTLWLGICGVDIIAQDYTAPVAWNAVVLELNSTPWLGWDRELTSVNTAKELLVRAFGIGK